MRNAFFAVLILPLAFTTTRARAAATLSVEHLRIDWVAPESFGTNAKDQSFGTGTEKIGIRFRMDEHWHVYWKNPGDSGAAPKFELTTENAKTGDIQWPVPQRLPYSHLTNLGYDKEVVYLFDVTPSASPVKISAKLEWLVCEKECIPGFGTLTLDRPMVGTTAVWKDEALAARDAFLKRVPTLTEPGEGEFRSKLTPESLTLHVQDPSARPEDPDPEIFPVDSNFLSPVAPVLTKTAEGWTFRFLIPEGKSIPASTGFVIADARGVREYAGIGTSPAVGQEGGLPLALILAMAFLGGLILNLMPCVLPVLSIKFFSLVKAAPETRVREGLLYTAGVLVTFTALGGVLAFLRAGGASVGWGYQLQSPLVILALALLFFLMALNFFGFFELGDGVVNLAGRHQGGAFASGVLAVFVAAPCTGPFMGTALGAAATMPALPSLLIFVFLGLGLASPFVAVAFFPRLAARMPKPGAWMDRFKQFLAFPLLGTVVWLLWVLGLQVGSDGWFFPALLFLGVTLAIWLGKSKSFLVMTCAWLVAFASIGVSARGILHAAQPVDPFAASAWKPYSSQTVSEARARKQAVFIDFTAAWCITCQVNKKVVLDTATAQELFRKNDVLLVRADWTKQDPAITKALTVFGRSSVPVYAFYAADGADAKILPQLLTISMIEELFPSTTKENP